MAAVVKHDGNGVAPNRWNMDMEAIQRSLVFSCGFKGFSLAEIVVQVVHKHADSFQILRKQSSSSKGILERDNRFLS
jgi:hypothetical protein